MDDYSEVGLDYSDKTLHFPGNGGVHLIGFFLLISVVAFGSFFLFTAYISDIPVSLSISLLSPTLGFHILFLEI